MNAAICWSSRKIKVKLEPTSTVEAELVGGVSASKDLKFVRNILKFMWAKPAGPTPLFIDSEGMWFNTRNDHVSALTRHWDQWLMFVRSCFKRLTLTPYKIATDDEVADILTKPIPKEDEKYFRFRNIAMNINQAKSK